MLRFSIHCGNLTASGVSRQTTHAIMAPSTGR